MLHLHISPGIGNSAWKELPPGHLVHIFPVASDQRVPAHDRKFLQHLQAVAQIADARARVVGPAYGNLNNPETAFARDEKYLRIKPPALDGLQLKYRLRGNPRERLESALRVGIGQTHD